MAAESLLVDDLRFTMRQLRRNPGFTTAVVLTLGLGIGAATTVLSVVYGMLWRPLSVANADRFVQIVQTIRSNGETAHAGLSAAQTIEWAAHATTVSQIGRYSSAPATLTEVGPAVRLNGIRISPGLFSALAGAPRAGRFFTDDDALSTEPVVVLSARAWSRYFGGAPDIVDRRVMLDAVVHRVIGVTAPGFETGIVPLTATSAPLRTADGAIADTPDIWRPLAPPVMPRATGGFSLFPVFAMLRPGVSREQAAEEARRLVPPLPQAPRGQRLALDLVSPRAEMGRQATRALALFAGVVGVLLLIGCLNAANLLLAHYAARGREIAVRASLGATRRQLALSVLVEAVVLALTGGAAGVLLTFWLVALVRTAPRQMLPGVQDVHVDLLALGFAAGLSVCAGLAVGTLAALRSVRGHALPDLSGRTATIVAGARVTPSRSLVAAQIAAATLLIAVAALLVDSFVRARAVPAGFDASQVLSFRLTLPPATYADASSRQRVVRDLTEGLRAIPGVTGVSATNGTLEGVALTWGAMTIDGRPQPGEPLVFNRRVTPEFFRLLRMSLRGRDFSTGDIRSEARVAIVNEAFARKFFNNIDPIGHRLTFTDWNVEIIGVSADARDATRDFNAIVQPALYLPPDAHYELTPIVVLLRSTAEFSRMVPAIQAAVARVDPRLAMYDTMSLEDLLAQRTASPQLYSLISSVTAAVAITLAAIGLYGLLNYVVGARTRELGVRMALGADRRRVVGIVLRDAATIVMAGAAAGIGGALIAARFLEVLLFEVRPGDPARLVFAVAVLIGVGLMAALVPARRATRIDPVAALRAE